MATDIATLGIKIEAGDIKQAVRELDRLERQSKDNEKSAKKLGGAFKGLSGIIAAVVGGAAAAGLIDTNRQFEKLKVSLKTVTGSAEEAATAFNLVQDFAKNAPFSVAELTQSFIKMRALGLEPTAETMRSFANTASAMGKSFDQFTEAVADAITGEFERLKEFGIKARSEGDKVSFTFQGVTKTIKKNSKEIQQYLTDIGNVQFAGAATAQMETLDGALSNLGDAFDELQVAIGEAGLNEAFTDIANSLAEFTRELTKSIALIKKGGGVMEQAGREWENAAALWSAVAEGQVDFWDALTAGPEDAIRILEGLGKSVNKVGKEFDGLPDEPPILLDPVTVKAIDQQIEAVHDLGEEWEIAIDLIEQQFRDVDEEHARLISGIEKGSEEAADAWEEMSKKMQESLSDTITDAIVDFKSFGDVAGSILNDVARMIVKTKISDPLAKGIMGAVDDFDIGSIFSADGGGFTGIGARSGGVDGKGGFPAILHPNETVVDHTKGQSMGGGNVINVTYSPQVNALDPRTASQVIAENAATIMGVVERSMNKRGRSAFT